MDTNERVFLLGEDLLDPYGGAFKVTSGLSTAFPGRVLTSPISEAGIVGVAAGMALRGLRPVVEIMFGDFLTLAADQLINHAAKFSWMYSGGKSEAERVTVPLVVRTPMGGRRGYGPTHSQTLEKHFLGAPGLRVLAPPALGEPGALLERAILETQVPLLFVENKLLYLLPVQGAETSPDFTFSRVFPTVDSPGAPSALDGLPLLAFPPTYQLNVSGAPPPSLTLAAYGYMAELARQAALRLAYEHELFCELVVPTQLAPMDAEAVLQSAGRTGRLLVLEEGGLTLGWGAEVLARAVQVFGRRSLVARRLAAPDLPLPAATQLEALALPGAEQIIQAAINMV
jgi:pyruvate/2-oxoglutarate/acetoin dehydrogenase E1 component